MSDVLENSTTVPDLDIAKCIKSTLKALGIPGDEESVYAVLVQILIDYALDSFEQLDEFFRQAPEVLIEKIRDLSHEEVEKQLVEQGSWEMPQQEKDTFYDRLDKTMHKLEKANVSIAQAFPVLCERNATLELVGKEWDEQYQGMSTKILNMMDRMIEGSFVGSASVTSMYPLFATAICNSQDINKELIKALEDEVDENAEVVNLVPVVKVVIEIAAKLEKIGNLVDKAIAENNSIVQFADGGSVMNDEMRAPQSPQVLGPSRKKSPARKYNWLRWEDMNPELDKPEASDPANTRTQFSHGQPESQMSMGGEPGNPVAPY